MEFRWFCPPQLDTQTRMHTLRPCMRSRTHVHLSTHTHTHTHTHTCGGFRPQQRGDGHADHHCDRARGAAVCPPTQRQGVLLGRAHRMWLASRFAYGVECVCSWVWLQCTYCAVCGRDRRDTLGSRLLTVCGEWDLQPRRFQPHLRRTHTRAHTQTDRDEIRHLAGFDRIKGIHLHPHAHARTHTHLSLIHI